MKICDKSLCTACGVCVSVCPKSCISWQKDELDTLLPVVDEEKCIKCGACLRFCHINNRPPLSKPYKCYAAWALDKETRRTSASGGITSVFYQYTIKRNGYTAGVELDVDRGAHYIDVKVNEDIERVKNSKYVYAHTDGVYRRVKDALSSGRFVFFVGLPCHVAALRTYLGKQYDNDNLLTADILCHGVVNEDYLFQYIKHIEIIKKRKAVNITFRDPADGTESFMFALRETKKNGEDTHTDKPFYRENHYGTNLYYIGYMDELQYRENCYHCRYARLERVSDLTFGDFDGLGRDKPFNFWNRQVSLCLVNSERGEAYLNKVADDLFMEERNIEEAVKPQKQLKAPAKGHPERKLFLEEYQRTHDFTDAARKALHREIYHNLRVRVLSYTIYKPLKFILPTNIVKKLKSLLK